MLTFDGFKLYRDLRYIPEGAPLLSPKDVRVADFKNSAVNAALYRAALESDEVAIRDLLQQGANPHARHALNGTTAVYVSIKNSMYDRREDKNVLILELLLSNRSEFPNESYVADHPASINNPNLHTPLCEAIQRWQEDSVRLLLARGASPSICSKQGCSPLWKAVEGENVASVFLLLKEGASFEDKYKALHYALKASIVKPLEMVTCLLESGQDPTIEDELGNSALHIAVQRPNTADEVRLYIVEPYPKQNADLTIKIIKMLLEKGAFINAVNKEGESAFHILAKLIAILRNGNNAHQISAEIGELILPSLLQEGVDFTVQNKEGVRAIECLPSVSQKRIRRTYSKLITHIISDLWLDSASLTQLQQRVCAEQWRRLDHKERVLLCFLLGVEYPSQAVGVLAIIKSFFSTYFFNQVLKWVFGSVKEELPSHNDFLAQLTKLPSLPKELRDMILIWVFSEKLLYDYSFLDTREAELQDSPKPYFLCLVNALKKRFPSNENMSETDYAVLRP